MDKNFLQIGDELESVNQNPYFNKGMKYKICNVEYFYNEKNDLNIRLSLIDKFGNIRDYYDSYFELTNKTMIAADLRKKKAYARIFWSTEQFAHHTSHLYNFEKTRFYNVSRAYFLANSDAIACVDSEQLDPTGSNGWKHLDRKHEKWVYKYEDFETWLIEQFANDKDNWYFNWNLPHIGFQRMEKLVIDNYLFYNEINRTELKQKISDSMFHFHHQMDKPLNQILNILAMISFDDIRYYKKYMGDVMCDVLDMFSYVPPSYGSTAITKFLMGKKNSIKKSEIMESLEGKYAGSITYNQMFALCNNLENYISYIGITNNDEDSGDRPYWIGNRKVNYSKLQEFKKEILKLGK